MLTVTLWMSGGDNECLGSWYPEDDQVQVPRKGDILWLDTDEHPHNRWKVVNVQWAFRNRKIGIGSTRTLSVEVHIKPHPAQRKT